MFRTAVSEFTLTGTSRRPRPSFQPAVETLEDRVVLSVSGGAQLLSPVGKVAPWLATVYTRNPAKLMRTPGGHGTEPPPFQNIPLPTPPPTKRLSETTKGYLNMAANGFATIGVGSLVAAGYAATAPEPGLTKGAAAALAGIGGVSVATAGGFRLLANDPPDSNFKQVVKVRERKPLQVKARQGQLPAKLVTAINNFLDNHAAEAAVQKALYTSMNRADGADQADKPRFEKLQVKSINKYRKQLGKLLQKEIKLRIKVSRVAAQTGFQLIGPLTAEQVAAFQQDVAVNGLPADLVATLGKLKPMDQDLESVRRTIIAQDPAAAAAVRDPFADPAILQALRNTASALRE